MENRAKESNNFSASKEISPISWNPKVHYHADTGCTCPVPDSILQQYGVLWRQTYLIQTYPNKRKRNKILDSVM
jgi:hypothetical protein